MILCFIILYHIILYCIILYCIVAGWLCSRVLASASTGRFAGEAGKGVGAKRGRAGSVRTACTPFVACFQPQVCNMASSHKCRVDISSLRVPSPRTVASLDLNVISLLASGQALIPKGRDSWNSWYESERKNTLDDRRMRGTLDISLLW